MFLDLSLSFNNTSWNFKSQFRYSKWFRMAIWRRKHFGTWNWAFKAYFNHLPLQGCDKTTTCCSIFRIVCIHFLLVFKVLWSGTDFFGLQWGQSKNFYGHCTTLESDCCHTHLSSDSPMNSSANSPSLHEISGLATKWPSLQKRPF